MYRVSGTFGPQEGSLGGQFKWLLLENLQEITVFMMWLHDFFAKTLKYYYVLKVLWNSGVAKNRVWDPPEAEKLKTFIILTEINDFEGALFYKKYDFCKNIDFL